MPRFVPVPISAADAEKLWDETSPSLAVAAQLANIRFGDKRHWPCPRCTREHAHEATFVRRIPVTADDDGTIREAPEATPAGATAEIQRARGFLDFLGDMTKGLFDKGVDTAMERLAPAARVYACGRHGEFCVIENLGEIQPGKVFLMRDARLVEMRPRYEICPGYIERVDATGARISVENCENILEAHGPWEDDGVGDCSYSCPIHGTQSLGADGSYREVDHLLVRAVD
jgi:hypothetical protein